jgi:hypothetical protein
VPSGSTVGLNEGSCVVFGQSMLEFVLSRVGNSGQQGSRERRPAAHKRRSEERRSGRQSPPSSAGSSGSRPASPQHQSKTPSKKRCRDADAQRDSGHHSDRVSSGTASPSSCHSSNSAKGALPPAVPPTISKTVRWSPDLARVHEVPGVDYPPDYFEATEQAVIIRNMFVAAVGGSDDEDDDPIANSVSESPVSTPTLPVLPSA